jgi:preprotein translocase subunit SecE
MKNILIGINNFLKEVRVELKKVNWPNKKDIIKHTLTVIAFLVLVGAYLGTVDFLFSQGLNKLIK